MHDACTSRLATRSRPTSRTSARKRSQGSDGRSDADARVEDHDPRHAVGVGDGEAEPDRPAPVVDDERQPLELELEREALDRHGSARRTSTRPGREACPSGRSRRGRGRQRGLPRRSSGSSCGRGTPTSARRGSGAPDRPSPPRRSAFSGRPARRSGRGRASPRGPRIARPACDKPPRGDSTRPGLRAAAAGKQSRHDMTRSVTIYRDTTERTCR